MKAFLFKHPWLAGGLALIFLLAGASKLGHSERTFAGIQQYGLFAANPAYAIAEALPWIEIGLGVSLLVPRLRFAALGGAGLLQLLFFIGLVQAVLRGREIVCVCFGPALGGAVELFLQETLLLGLTLLAGWREWKFRTNELESLLAFRQHRGVKFPGVAFVLGFLLANSLQAGLVDSLDSKELRTLERGEPVLVTEEVKGFPWPRIAVYRMVDSTPEEAMAVFFDYNSAREFIPNVKKSEISKDLNACSQEVAYAV
ncbi:MAG TPA: MauE/DoxX family redox-associated membrane protein, partial [Chthoniobacterales bacterium]